MSGSAVLRTGWHEPARSADGSVGLWVFIGVASALFALFLAAYLMRMAADDWSPIVLPAPLWLGSALLLAGCVLMQRAAGAARRADWPSARAGLAAGGACALAFVAAQGWAWQALFAGQVRPAGNPSASFFFLLTAMHALHVLGGLLAWGLTVRAGVPPADPARGAARIALCARYWHFLLAVWAVLFAAMAWLTPEIARAVCGRG